MNNSQALIRLKQSAKMQTEELKLFIQEIHQENWNKLSSDLQNIMIKRLNTIEKNINETMNDIKLQNKNRYSLKQMIWTSVTTALIFLFAGMILMEYTPKYQKWEKWIVPEEMRHEDKETGSRYIRSNEPYTSEDRQTTFIKIGG